MEKRMEKAPEMRPHPGRPHGMKSNFFITAAGVLIAVISIELLLISFRNGRTALWDSFNDSKDQSEEATKQNLHDKYYQETWEKYRVSNEAVIQVSGVRETATLEVLKVSDVEYIISDTDDNDNGITAWLEVPGNGVFTVDLTAAEFIVDDERSYVLVRVPEPEISNITIDYTQTEKLLFKNDLLNDSYAVGEDLANSMEDTAIALIQQEFESNQYYYENAQAAATRDIEYLVKSLNPSVQNLTVEVEFVD